MVAGNKISDNFLFTSVQLLLPIDLEYRILISKLIQDSYKEGFLNGISIRKTENDETELTQNEIV